MCPVCVADGSQASPNSALLETVSTTSLTEIEIHSLIEMLQVKLGTAAVPPALAQWTKVGTPPSCSECAGPRHNARAHAALAITYLHPQME